MGTQIQHQQKAEHHLAFLGTISDDYPDWLATVAFYAAVELVEVLAAIRGHHSTSHEGRKDYVRKNLVRIHQAFHKLYNASLDARYEPLSQCLSAQDVRKELIDRSLKQIQSFAASQCQQSRQSDAP
jgi:hypothetical protein